MPRPIRRPVPIERGIIRRAPVPVPLHGVPEIRNEMIEIAFSLARPIKILARGQQAFHQKSSLNQIAAVVEHVEHGKSLSARSIHEMRPGTVITRSAFEKR